MSCCPENAWGDLKNPDYKEKGSVEKVIKKIQNSKFNYQN
jgi:hypothetical protein